MLAARVRGCAAVSLNTPFLAGGCFMSWYDDKNKLTHIETHKNEKDASKDADKAAAQSPCGLWQGRA